MLAHPLQWIFRLSIQILQRTCHSITGKSGAVEQRTYEQKKIPESFECRLKFPAFLDWRLSLEPSCFKTAPVHRQGRTHAESVHTCITQLSVNSGGFVWLPEWAITQAVFKRGWSDFFFSFLNCLGAQKPNRTECLDNKHKTHRVELSVGDVTWHRYIVCSDASSICSLIPDDKSQFPEIYTICLFDLCLSCCFASLFQNQSTV